MSYSLTQGSIPWRTLLVLGRVSNLPTVWSNCLAGWWLGGGGSIGRLVGLGLGASCLYLGGMYLNDAFDVEFDRQFRRERPIPSGAIRIETVWRLGLLWMVLGLASLAPLGTKPVVLALVLTSSIVLYDALHKFITFSPVLMAACRFWLVLLAASTGQGSIDGLALWTAFALAAYIVGLSYVAKFESVPGALRYWPVLFLGAPLVLAYFANTGEFRGPARVFGLVLVAWVTWALRHTFWSPQRNFGRTVSGLLAGIVLVDLLAVCGGLPTAPVMSILFLLLFAAALLAQRFVPAT